LRQQDFRNVVVKMKLSRPSAYPAELFHVLRKGFSYVCKPKIMYRSTGVVLSGLESAKGLQYSLFDDVVKIEKFSRVYNVVDRISKKFGKHSLCHASSLPTKLQTQHEGARGDIPERKKELFSGESKRQRLGLPVLRVKV
jgi:hypothetical protein